MDQKGLWNVARKKKLQHRGARCLREEGDIVREDKATHEENFLSSWLREDVEGIEERRKNFEEKAREEESRSGTEKGGEKSRRER